jgi:hypothetical protein
MRVVHLCVEVAEANSPTGALGSQRVQARQPVATAQVQATQRRQVLPTAIATTTATTFSAAAASALALFVLFGAFLFLPVLVLRQEHRVLVGIQIPHEV